MISSALLAFQEWGLVKDAVVVWVMLAVAGVAGALLCSSHGSLEVLIADFFMYPSIVYVAAVAEGIAFEVASPNSLFRMPNLMVATNVIDGAAKACSTPLARYLIDEGGRTVYACVLLVVIATMAVACGITATLLRCAPRSDTQDLVQEDVEMVARLPTAPVSDCCFPGSHQPRAWEDISTKVDGDFLMTLDCEMPKGMEIRDTQYGKGLFATEPISAGQLICKSKFYFVSDRPGKVLLNVSGQSFVLDVGIHFPLLRPGCREVNAFDSFTNHSCEANIFYDDIRHDDSDWSTGEYSTYASRDISPGTELACDYEKFEWDCLDKSILRCMCGAATCRKSIRGLRYIPFEVALTMLAELEPLLRDHFLREHPEVCYLDMGRNAGVSMVRGESHECALAAADDFESGAVVYEGLSCVIQRGSVQYVACNFPVRLASGCWRPNAIVFVAQDIERVSAAIPGFPGRREFFGFAIEASTSRANAEIRPNGSEGRDEHGGRHFQVRPMATISKGQVLACAAPP